MFLPDEVKAFKIKEKHRSILERLCAPAYRRFREEFLRLGGKEAEFEKLMNDFKDPFFTAETKLLSMIHSLSKKGVAIFHHQFNILVREYQALDNHYVRLIDGDFISKFLFFTLENKEFKIWRQPRNLNKFLELCALAHGEIDIFFAKRIEGSDELYRSMDDLMLQIKGKRDPNMPKEIQERRLELNSAGSASHHVLDWYLLTCPQIAHNKTARKLAALSIGAVCRLNSIVFRKNPPFSLKELGLFGGWKGGASSFSSASRSFFFDVIYAVVDIPLAFYYNKEEPDDWFKRLSEIIPNLKKGSVMSPFPDLF